MLSTRNKSMHTHTHTVERIQTPNLLSHREESLKHSKAAGHVYSSFSVMDIQHSSGQKACSLVTRQLHMN